MSQSSTNSILIHSTAEKLYNAFTDPVALEQWQAPEGMTGKVHHFDLREGGGYKMSLYYPDSDDKTAGKTGAKEDRFTATYTELVPFSKIVQVIRFNSDKEEFAGEMTMETVFKEQDNGTEVSITYHNIPNGIKPEDNEAGTASSLQKLSEYVAGH